MKIKDPLILLKDGKSSLRVLTAYLLKFPKYMTIVALTSFLTVLLSVGTSVIVYFISRQLMSPGGFSSLGQLSMFCGILLACYILYAFSSFTIYAIMVFVAEKVGYEIRKDLFSKIQDLKISYFDQNKSGDIMSKITNDVNNITILLSQNFAPIIGGMISILGILISMFCISPFLSLFVLAFILIIFIIIAFIGKKSQPLFQKQQEALGILNGEVEEYISGHNIIKLFGQSKTVENDFGKINEELSKNSLKAQTYSSCIIPLNGFLNNMTTIIAAVIGGILIVSGVGLGGVLGNSLRESISSLTLFIILLRQFTQPIAQIMRVSNLVQMCIASSKRTFSVFNEPSEHLAREVKEITNLKGSVNLKNVFFSYHKETLILNDVSISAKANEKIAIVGPTGSGKTTITNLLIKFYNCDQGEILFDDYDISEITKKSLRNNISAILQDTFIFDGTVLENLKIANFKATKKEIIEVCKLTSCDKFINKLPNKYNEVLHNNGENLSQGERQLLSIARAMLDPGKILIVDEATSNIDTKTEIEIQKALSLIMKNKTSFTIAHRLSTIINSDKIILLKDGVVLEVGTHKQLLAQNGYYSSMYNSQFRFLKN